MNTELIINASTAFGAATLGATGAIIAARIQARPAERAAAAAREQAEAAYRAALDTAHAQIAASARQEANAARRPLYMAFGRAAERLGDTVFDDVANPDTDESEYASALQEARAAYADLHFAGPRHVVDAAHTCVDKAIDAHREGLQHGVTIQVLNKFQDLMQGVDAAHLGFDIDLARQSVLSQVATIPEAWVSAHVLRLGSFPDGEDAVRQATREGEGVVDGRPYDFNLQGLYAAGRELDGYLRQADQGGHFSYDGDAFRLYWVLFHWRDDDPLNFARKTVRGARLAVQEFGRACDAVLHGADDAARTSSSAAQGESTR
ncbi:hypothetical protein [Streptomyces sp. NPDC017964]|uniref:hypothetical protein n=1 Tax=Streptomyces sp. NPDC017964 TaxID=3365022 RepID=UPI0037B729CE